MASQYGASNIKIYDELWVVKEIGNEGTTNENLSHMSHVTSDSTFSNRQETGRKWAAKYSNPATPEEHVYKNVPMKGFKLGKSVSRWSTDNKLFRLEDPRGFVVEISTGNLEMLMRDVTIVKGEIQEECLWGREKNNILVSVNSEPYLNSYKPSNTTVSVKSLKIGDEVRMTNGKKYIYAGMIKPTFKIPVVKRKLKPNSYQIDGQDIITEWLTVEGKFMHYFKEEDKTVVYNVISNDKEAELNSYVCFSNPKIMTILSHDNNIGDIQNGWYGNAFGQIPVPFVYTDKANEPNTRYSAYQWNRRTQQIETK